MLRKKYQPLSIDQLVGQDVVKTIFKRVLEMNNHNEPIYPTFLLYGSRGLGKTLSSRLFTQTINCSNKINYYTPCHKCNNCVSIDQNTNPDFVEIDGATYNGIDNIRTFIIDHSKYAPIHLPFRVYLIDEVHMLTKESFNSLLKTIEYPPERIIFLLATTELEKIPDTVQSRCLILNFQPISKPLLIDFSKKLLADENHPLPDDVLNILINISGGSARDLMVLLEKALLCKVASMEDCIKNFGCCSYNDIIDIYFNILSGERDKALDKWKSLMDYGCSQKFFLYNLLEIIGDIILYKNNNNASMVYGYNIPPSVKDVDNNFIIKHWEIIHYMISMEKFFQYNTHWVLLSIVFLCHITYSIGDEKTMDILSKLLPVGHFVLR
jgi:DNA polymerase-3 subunit gamma/tau